MSRTAFEAAFARTVGLEGGHVNDPRDRGGETKFGISKRSHPNEDIAALSLDRAKAIYWDEYWHAAKLDQVVDPEVAGEIFDTAVNCGVPRAVMIAQEALNFWMGEKLFVDGVMGPRTLGALHRWSTRDKPGLLRALNFEQGRWYRSIIERDPSQAAFARGWLKRLA